MAPPEMSVQEKITYYAQKHRVDAELMRSTVACETANTFDPSIKSGYAEDSWGLAQIHLPSWPDISKKEATDPDFALNFMAEKFANGQHDLWTCYRLLAKGHLFQYAD